MIVRVEEVSSCCENSEFDNLEDGCNNAKAAEFFDDDMSVYNNLVGDGVEDTPAHAKPTDEYPGYESCWRNASLNTCDDDIPGIDKGTDPIDNCTCSENYIS